MTGKKIFISLTSILILSVLIYITNIVLDNILVINNVDFSIYGQDHYRIIELKKAYPIIIPFITSVSVFVWNFFLKKSVRGKFVVNYFHCVLAFFLVLFFSSIGIGNFAFSDGYTFKFFSVTSLIGGFYPYLSSKNGG